MPVWLAWLDERVVIAVSDKSRTARDISATRRARLGIGPTRDVVMIDAVLQSATAVAEAPAHLADGYVSQARWDPRDASGYSYLELRPRRIQAWRESNEIAG